jgi:hypothetical protein
MLDHALTQVAPANYDTQGLPPECYRLTMLKRTRKPAKLRQFVACCLGCVLLTQEHAEPLDIDGRHEECLAACNDPKSALTTKPVADVTGEAEGAQHVRVRDEPG